MCNANAVSQFGLGAEAGGAAASTVGAWYAARASKDDLKARADLADLNARLAEMDAQAALKSGARQEQALRLSTANLRAKQRVATAANGVDLSSRSVQQVAAGTEWMGEVDADAIRMNAVSAAFGARTQATNFRNQARMNRAGASAITPMFAALSTLATSGSRVASSWYGLKKSGALDPTTQAPAPVESRDRPAYAADDDPIQRAGKDRGWW